MHFWKSCGIILIWLLLSELLCLVIAVSFAILSASWCRWLGLICGVTAHCLLIGSCAQKIAKEDTARYRLTGKRAGQVKPLLLAVSAAVPAVLLYALLCMLRHSILMTNLFSLLNAPFIQYHRFVFDGAETFAALSVLRRILTALPPLVTAAAFWIGYQVTYIPALARMDANSPRA